MTVEELIEKLRTFHQDYQVHHRYLFDEYVIYSTIDVYENLETKTVIIDANEEVACI